MAAAGAVGAAAGFGYAAFTNVVAPELAGFLLGTETLIWTALGGRATLFGPVLGAIGIDVTASYLSGSLPFLWKLIVGIAFVVVIVVLPRGLAPLFAWAARRLVAPFRRGEPPAEETIDLVPMPPRPATERATAVPIRTEELTRHYGSLKVLDGIDVQGRAASCSASSGRTVPARRR